MRPDVLSPEKLKSYVPSLIMGRGNWIAAAFPFSARFEISGPPGYENPRTFPNLSNASPAASSRVDPIFFHDVGFFIHTISVWPPETMSASIGNSGSFWLTSDE